MKRKLALIFTLLIALSALLVQPLGAQSDDLPPMVAVVDGELVYFAADGTQTRIADADQFVFNLTWSPDGSRVAYKTFEQELSGFALKSVSVPDGEVEMIIGDTGDLPAAFSTDGQQVIYIQPVSWEELSEEMAQGPDYPVTVVTQSLHADAEPQVLGEIMYGTGCGGGSIFPMDGVYSEEAGFFGNNVIFTNTDFGIVYSLNCAGLGLGLFDTTSGESTVLDSDIARASISPDGIRIGGVLLDQMTMEAAHRLAIIDIATGELTALDTQFRPDQVVWGSDDVLYYSTRDRDGSLDLTETQSAVFAEWLNDPEFDVPNFAYSIRRFDLNTGSDEATGVEGSGWAVGRMFAVGEHLYFSIVPGGEAWVEALESDDMTSDTLYDPRVIRTALYRIPLAGGEPELIGEDISRATPQP